MSMNYNTTPEHLAAVLSQSVQAGLEAAIRAELMKSAEKIVAEVARTMARNIRGRVHSYRQHGAGFGDVQICIALDGVKDCAEE